jgi:hypothetical protein
LRQACRAFGADVEKLRAGATGRPPRPGCVCRFTSLLFSSPGCSPRGVRGGFVQVVVGQRPGELEQSLHLAALLTPRDDERRDLREGGEQILRAPSAVQDQHRVAVLGFDWRHDLGVRRLEPGDHVPEFLLVVVRQVKGDRVEKLVGIHPPGEGGPDHAADKLGNERRVVRGTERHHHLRPRAEVH